MKATWLILLGSHIELILIHLIFFDKGKIHSHLPMRLDGNNGGMPDESKKKDGLDPRDPPNASKDNDNDGYTNIAEYLNSLLDGFMLSRIGFASIGYESRNLRCDRWMLCL